VAESVQSASVTTNTPLQSAMPPSSGTAQQPLPRRPSKGTWSQQTVSHSASTGRSEVVDPQATQNDTCAWGVGRPIMGLKDALEQRRSEPLTPYRMGAWAEQLSALSLGERYPLLGQGLTDGFDLGIPHIHCTSTPLNHPSVRTLLDVYNSIVNSKFTASCYICPFSHYQLEQALGPFQTSPLSLVPKMSKPGSYQAVHDFSHLHDPSPEVSSINSHIDCNRFPCTWSTFSTVALLIARLPPRSQASVHDVAEAYRTIPALPAQWPGLVIHLLLEDQFAINTCNNFSLTSAGGVYGMSANAGTDIFWGQGMGPLSKWVDDHIFFQVLWRHLPSYNAQHEWHCEIREHGGQRQEGGHRWYRGKSLLNSATEEFDEDCSTTLCDLAKSSPQPSADHGFAYADADIDRLSVCLSIRWQTAKSVPFGTEVLYLGFCWDLHSQVVHLPNEKKLRYLTAITEWGKKCMHNLQETQKLYGKLFHAALVIPAGHAHLTSMEAMLASFNNSPFLPHTPP
jgi:hypothetical protein